MIVEFINYLLSALTGCCFELFVLNKLVGYGIKVKKTMLCAAIPISLAILIISVRLGSGFPDMAVFVTSAVIPFCVLDSKKKLPIFWLVAFVSGSFDLVAEIITKAIHIQNSMVFQFIFSGLSVFSLLVCIVIYRRQGFSVPRDFIEQIPNTFYIVTMVALFVISSIFEVIESNENYRTLMFIIIGIFVVTAFVCLSYIAFKYVTVSFKQRDSMIQLDMQTRHYEELAQKNQDIRRFRHDLKNNMFALNILLSDGKYDEAKQYIESMSFALKETESKFSTGNYLADAILSNKADEANKAGIEITFDGALPADKISNDDMCTILANTLDNAIRACLSLSPCTIKIEASESVKGCTVIISNPVSEKVEIKNNSIKTTKKDTVNHGLGIGNIKRIAEKYNGYTKLDCSDTEFSIKIGLLYQ